ncbi:MAG: hypothetical protein ACI8X5_002126 [Planctomycetota bacterium]|jgi:hypothetical protein
MPEPSTARSVSWSLSPALRAALVCFALGVYWVVTLDMQRSWGWDEASHAELPAVRMLLSVQEGDFSGFFRVLHTCQQYPFGWPLVLAAVQGLFGISEWVCRAAGLGVWALTLWGVFLLAQEVVRARRPYGEGRLRGDDLLPWLALGFAALSPMALGYGASLFLEVPFTCCAVFALRAWLRRTTMRGERGEGMRAIWASLLLAAAFFVKFNYGILLVAGCGLDWLVGLMLAKRAGRFWSEIHCLPFLALPFLFAVGWWLLLPLPYGFEMGADHRRVLFAFLSSNQEMAATPWSQRLIFMAICLTFTARLFAVQLLGLFGSVAGVLAPGARLLWLVLLAMGIPVWTHNFHLDRFLIPSAPVFWILAACGISGILPISAIGRSLSIGGLSLLLLFKPGADGPWLAEKLGLLRGDQSTQDYISSILSEKHRLGADRQMWTPGISPQATAEIMGLVHAEVGASESLGWIGINTELCPAAIHLSLLSESGNRARFLRESHLPMDVTFTGSDPGWNADQLRAFTKRFDVMISTDPADIGNRGARAFTRNYATMLMDELGWQVRELGKVMIPKDRGAAMQLSVYALRPPAAEKGGDESQK